MKQELNIDKQKKTTQKNKEHQEGLRQHAVVRSRR
jgi:hypothetical protein